MMTQLPKLKVEMWGKPVEGVFGTIRTEPENYYVADIKEKELVFRGIEAATRNIDKNAVAEWYKNYKTMSKSLSLIVYESILSELEFLEEGWIDALRRIPRFVGLHKIKEPGERGLSIGGKSEYGFKLDLDGEIYEIYYSDPMSVKKAVGFLQHEGKIGVFGIPINLRFPLRKSRGVPR